jgi:NADH dehydrogenase
MGACYNSPSAFLRAKRESEDAVREFFPDAVILRPNLIHGETDRFLDRLAEFCFYFYAMPVIDGGKATCQPLFVHDFANAVMNAMTYTKAAGNTYELAGPEVFTQREIAEFVIEFCRFPTTGGRSQIMSLPSGPAKFLGRVVNKIPWQRWRYLTEDIAIRMSTDNTYTGETGSLSIADLGIKPQKLEDSAVHALQVFRAEYIPLHGMDAATETGRNY